MDEWHNLLPSADLPPGGVAACSWQDNDLLVYRTPNGDCVAMNAYCPHQGNYIPNGLPGGRPLDELLVDEEILCPFHGWRFNSAGQCSHIPPGQRVPPAVRQGRRVIRCWQLRELEQQIQICGEPASTGQQL